MSRLTELISQIKSKDSQLGVDLEREFKALSSRREFGLNFERHRPEIVELPNRVVRKGDKVRILPERGSTKKGDQQLWLVKKIIKNKKEGIATLVSTTKEEKATKETNINDLIVVAEFQDYIYPGLVSTGQVENGDAKPYHTVINGENYHALKALTFTHKGKIDAIYIDPPYNTGAKDWKYNNDYVESEDLYRHSKWLAFMERRLLKAKELLNPEESVLILTIDEKEFLRIGLLLEQMFPEANIQMVSSVINPKGATRSSGFGRTDEYLFFVMIGNASPQSLPLDIEWKIIRDKRAERLRWAELLRSGSDPLRSNSPNLFYPIFIKNTSDGPIFDSVGETYIGDDWMNLKAPKDCVAIWPIRSNGAEGRWQYSASSFRTLLKNGYARLGKWRSENTSITYIAKGEQKKVESGSFPIIGRKQDNSIIVDESMYTPQFVPGSQWRIQSHNAEQGGTNLLKRLMPDRKFPFPKSLYAVEDALRFFIKDKPNAIVLDFFSGSGTTAHALMRLNKQDNGNRQSISVTNNEVSANEQKELIKKGLRPGDGDWEKWGICDYITKPRIKAAITGKTPDGKSIKGDYKFTDEFPMSEGFKENAEFFTLTYETPISISYNLAFEHIAPLLWMRAGSKGKRIDSIPETGWAVADSYGVLFDLDKSSEFYKALNAQTNIKIAYVVTDDDRRFQSIAKRLPKGVEPVRLYESYLKNFQFTNDI